MSTLPTASHRETWRDADSIWSVAARLLPQSGYGVVSDLADAIRAANPRIIDWSRLAAGSVVIVPLRTGARP
jgi:Tfp pilus assembly protein FimV